MWYVGILALYLWQFLGHGKYVPAHNFLHAPLTGSHPAWLAAVVVASLFVAVFLERKVGDPLPGHSSFFMAAAFAFVGFLWYLVEIHAKPPVNQTIVKPTVTVTAQPPPATQVHNTSVSFFPHLGGWEIVGIVGIGAVVIITCVSLARFIL